MEKNSAAKKMTTEIDLMESAAYVVIEGRLLTITPKEFGEDTLIWKNNEVIDIIRSQRFRAANKTII